MKQLFLLITGLVFIALVLISRRPGITDNHSFTDPVTAMVREPATAMGSTLFAKQVAIAQKAAEASTSGPAVPQQRYASMQVGDDVFTKLRIKSVYSGAVATTTDPVTIDRLIAILCFASEVKPRASLRSRFTHTLMLREFWWFDAETGEVGVLFSNQPVYQIPSEFRKEFERLLTDA